MNSAEFVSDVNDEEIYTIDKFIELLIKLLLNSRSTVPFKLNTSQKYTVEAQAANLQQEVALYIQSYKVYLEKSLRWLWVDRWRRRY